MSCALHIVNTYASGDGCGCTSQVVYFDNEAAAIAAKKTLEETYRGSGYSYVWITLLLNVT